MFSELMPISIKIYHHHDCLVIHFLRYENGQKKTEIKNLYLVFISNVLFSFLIIIFYTNKKEMSILVTGADPNYINCRS